MTDDVALVPRPLQHTTFPKEAARENLADRLVKELRFDPRHAAALARVVVDPAAVRLQIANPLVKRFPGGIAKFVVADVFTPGVVASLINPRESSEIVYPIAARPGERVWPPLTVETVPGDLPVLRLVASSREHVSRLTLQSADRLRRRVALREAIALDGVLEPVTIILTELHHRDASEPIIIPMAVDGSTRTTLAHDLTNIDPVDVIYDLPNAPIREWRGRIGQILSVQDKPDVEVSEQERVAHRALTYQARILVAVEPVRGGKPVDVVMACRAIVGGIHVGHPEEWPQGSEIDEIAEAVLDQLVHDHKIAPETRHYLAGLIESKDLQQYGFSPYPDERAAHIIRTIYESRNSGSISIGYRGLVAKTQLTKEDKPNIAAELIMRAVRTNLRSNEVDAVRSSLQRTIDMPDLRNGAWRVSGRTPDELLAMALQELAAADGSIREARLELAALGIYWLVTKRILKRDTRNSRDQRAGAQIIRTMLQSERGLRQLYQAIIDGRADLHGNNRIMAVDKDGKHLPLAGGGLAVVDDDWLRKTFPAPGAYSPESLGEGDARSSPEGQFSRGILDLQNLADNVRDLVQRLDRIAAGTGVPEPIAKDLADKLRYATDRISLWGLVHSAKNSQLPLDGFDELDPFNEANEANV